MLHRTKCNLVAIRNRLRIEAFRLAGALSLILHLLFSWPVPTHAQEMPYFVTYSHQMEEPGNLELSFNPVVGLPRTSRGFVGTTTEIEYGAKGWWTTEFYLDGQSTRGDSTIFTGFRWENRFRLLMREHWINPVLYVEFEDINAADKSLKEVVGHDVEQDWADPNHEARPEKEREIETKLILSSNFHGWNVSENFIAEKNLANAPWEFGYAVGVNRPLGLEAASRACNLCLENFRGGLEMFGGLGDWHSFGFRDTSHYLGPLLSWESRNGTTIRFSPAFGLTQGSARILLRFGVSYELAGMGHRVRQMFRWR